jgi:homoserine O-acetyltransferase
LAGDGRAYGSRFPRITVGDQVGAERLLAEHLGIGRWAGIVGGSMGGMRVLEWAVGSPDSVASALVLAVGATATADQIGTQAVQTLAITSDPQWLGGDYYDQAPGQGPTEGMGLARRIAHLTYRTELELHARFGINYQDGEDPLDGGRYAVQSYLDHHADKLSHRFDAGTYLALTDAMTMWDLGRGRGGFEAALAGLRVPLVVGGIDSDRLYPLYLQQQIADLVPSTVGGLRVIPSDFGHDGFLIEHEQVFALVAEMLDLAEAAAA